MWFLNLEGASFPDPIPKGLRPSAQGCEERATLGKGTEKTGSTPTGLWHFGYVPGTWVTVNPCAGEKVLPVYRNIHLRCLSSASPTFNYTQATLAGFIGSCDEARLDYGVNNKRKFADA